ncbi:MerR family transcriptional regulator [Couchioplanes caeruleus]|uniref:MerR family transcriptional regulator n=1 Tax=Couchioplanes caeruleus TaxID=56438 RepID=UPI0020C08A0D|nr:MerR family transcriptional regulator [Couchioplanes caeruleus]UQU61530.1 MerR family transcriptional regulator [Couchioplanes caeruleus]
MRIGEVAAAAGVSPRALRYYEEQGLLSSQRHASGQRHYGEDAVQRVRWIQALYAAGLSSKSITGLVGCVHTGVATDAMRAQLAAERERIDTQIRDLTNTRDRLDAIIAAADDPDRRRASSGCEA